MDGESAWPPYHEVGLGGQHQAKLQRKGEGQGPEGGQVAVILPQPHVQRVACKHKEGQHNE